MKKISKKEAQEKIDDFFSDIKNKSPAEIRKIIKLAMKNSIKLKNKRKLFCKKCLSPYKNPKTKIDKKIKSTECENCGYVGRWKLK